AARGPHRVRPRPARRRSASWRTAGVRADVLEQVFVRHQAGRVPSLLVLEAPSGARTRVTRQAPKGDEDGATRYLGRYTVGLDPEVAWNYGVSLMQDFLIFGKKTEVIADFYRTDFENQVVVDLYASPQQALFYNLDGSSYANSFQLELNYEITHHFNIRTAY